MSEPWSTLPKVLAGDVAACWSSVIGDGHAPWMATSEGLSEDDVANAMARSVFLKQTLERHPEQVEALILSRSLREPTSPEYLKQRWQEYLADVSDELSLHAALRRFRRESQFRIIWRDLMRWADLHETMAATSGFAETCIQGALDWLYEDTCEQSGTPWGADPTHVHRRPTASDTARGYSI